MPHTRKPGRGLSGLLSCYDEAAALREENERVYPYGPPPPQVDPQQWVELAEAVYLGQFVAGLDLHHHQVRNLAAFIADRVLVTDPREAVSAQ